MSDKPITGALGIEYTRHDHPLRYDYTLTKDWAVWIPDNGLPRFPRTFENRWLRIEWKYKDGAKTPTLGILITDRKGYAWDGATAVPDKGAVEGSAVHDPIYQFAGEIAALWNWPISCVLELGDKCFLAVMEEAHSPVAHLYYTGVRLIGNLFWHVAHFREWTRGKTITAGQVTNGRTATAPLTA